MDLTLDKIGKQYGQVWVLEHIDLNIAKGEFFSLLGGSGSGKTTLLKSIAGIESPDRGRILFNDQDIVNTPMEKRPFNTVFQGYALFPHMSVYENIAFGLRVKGFEEKRILKIVNEMIERVGLTERTHAYPAQLSGGQQQRVAIARVLVCEPKVILLDEPLSALDASLRGQMQRFLKELHRDLGLTFIFVTHDQDEAISLSDRICILNKGHIEQVDTPDALYHSPKTTYVADFIGTNNLIPFTGKGKTALGSVELEGSAGSVLSIRPEAIQLGTQTDDASPGLVVSASLVDRQFHGDNTVMTFRTRAGQELITRRPGRGEDLNIGESANLTLPIAACSVISEGAPQ